MHASHVVAFFQVLGTSSERARVDRASSARKPQVTEVDERDLLRGPAFKRPKLATTLPRGPLPGLSSGLAHKKTAYSAVNEAPAAGVSSAMVHTITAR